MPQRRCFPLQQPSPWPSPGLPGSGIPDTNNLRGFVAFFVSALTLRSRVDTCNSCRNMLHVLQESPTSLTSFFQGMAETEEGRPMNQADAGVICFIRLKAPRASHPRMPLGQTGCGTSCTPPLRSRHRHQSPCHRARLQTGQGPPHSCMPRCSSGRAGIVGLRMRMGAEGANGL